MASAVEWGSVSVPLGKTLPWLIILLKAKSWREREKEEGAQRCLKILYLLYEGRTHPTPLLLTIQVLRTVIVIGHLCDKNV
jgi:hypothetical protein